MTTCLTYTKSRLLISNTPLLAYALGPNCVSCVSPIAFLLYAWSPYLTSNNLKQIHLSMMTLLDVAAYQQKIKLSHRLEDWGYIDCFLKPMQITLLKKKERKLEISFQFYMCKINSFHCNTGHRDVQDVGSIGVAFMNLTYTCKKYSPSYSLSKHWKSLDRPWGWEFRWWPLM